MEGESNQWWAEHNSGNTRAGRCPKAHVERQAEQSWGAGGAERHQDAGEAERRPGTGGVGQQGQVKL
jgi:hypothetical protein